MMDQQNFEATRPVSADPAVALAKALGQWPKAPAVAPNLVAKTSVEALAQELDYIERLDRLATIAESRRNASLREIDRRRAVLGETLRRSVQEAEDREFEVIEVTPAEGENAA